MVPDLFGCSRPFIVGCKLQGPAKGWFLGWVNLRGSQEAISPNLWTTFLLGPVEKGLYLEFYHNQNNQNWKYQ